MAVLVLVNPSSLLTGGAENTRPQQKALCIGGMMNGSHDYTVAPAVPVTRDRPLPVDLDKVIQNPGAARATRAVTKENPEGTANCKHSFSYFNFGMGNQNQRHLDRSGLGAQCKRACRWIHV